MSTTFAPFVEAGLPDSTDALASQAAKPVSSFLKPTLNSWINAPYYHPPVSTKPLIIESVELPADSFAPQQIAESSAQNDTQSEVESNAQVEVLAAPNVPVPVVATRHYLPTVPDTVVLAGFDVNKLSPDLRVVAAESHITHVQTVIRFLQKGGEGAKTFGKIFLNDLVLQRSILNDLMGESSSALSQLDSLQRELALRLATCVQARQVAQLILVDV